MANDNNHLSYENEKRKKLEDAHVLNWIASNQGLIRKTTGSYVNNNSVFFSKEDVEQEAYFTVVKAEKQYDSSKKATFSTYVCASVTNNLNFLVRKVKAQKRNSLDGKSMLSLSSDGEHGILDVKEQVNSIHAKEDLMDTEKLLENIHNIAEKVCSESEKFLLDMLISTYYTGIKITQKEMADQMNCSQATISGKTKLLQNKLIHELHLQGLT